MIKQFFTDKNGDVFNIYIGEYGVEIWSSGTEHCIYKCIPIKNGKIVWGFLSLRQSVKDVADAFVKSNIDEVNKMIPRINSYFCKFEDIEDIIECSTAEDAFSIFQMNIACERREKGMNIFDAVKIDKSKIIIKEI